MGLHANIFISINAPHTISFCHPRRDVRCFCYQPEIHNKVVCVIRNYPLMCAILIAYEAVPMFLISQTMEFDGWCEELRRRYKLEFPNHCSMLRYRGRLNVKQYTWSAYHILWVPTLQWCQVSKPQVYLGYQICHTMKSYTRMSNQNLSSF